MGNRFGAKRNDFLLEVADKFSEKELKTLWNLLMKLYAFDDVEFNGFEEEVGGRE